MWTSNLSPAGMTFDSGRDLLFSYSDERLCLPSDNCSLRGRERSINQNGLRYRTTPPPTVQPASANPGTKNPEASPPRNPAGQDAVVPRWQSATSPDSLQSQPLNRADMGRRGELVPLSSCQMELPLNLTLKQSARCTYGIVRLSFLTCPREGGGWRGG